MVLGERIQQQRVKSIISSYQLAGQDTDAFDSRLDDLLQNYPAPLLELAMVESLIENWLRMPMARGCAFLAQVQQRLDQWEARSFHTTIAPEQFQQITGLSPDPVFGSAGTPPSQPPTRSFL